jgi:hypothetical protein
VSYLELAQQQNLSVSHSKLESLEILNKYKDDGPHETYALLQYAIGTQAIEDMYLDEKEILLQIARQSGELSSDDLVEMVRSNNF